MPKLGMTMEEGTVVTWQIAVGQRIEKGATLLVIESEKTEAEIEAPAMGVLRHVYVEAGSTVPCGTLLAALTETADEPFDPEGVRRAHVPEAGMRAAAAPAARASTLASTGAQPRARAQTPAAPAARKRAAELGIELDQVEGTGPGGRITREDVEAAAAALGARVEVAPGVHLDVPAEGEGDPVMLLPGFGVDASSFALQMRALCESFRVYGVNPRGVARSSAPEAEAYEVAQTAADAAVVAERPAHVIGASLGAAAALELARVQPERVRTLTLVTPFVRATPRLLAVTEAWAALAAAAPPAVLARALLPWLFSTRTLADDAARERFARGLAQSVARVRAPTLARARAGLERWSGTRAGALSALRIPTLLISAGEDLLTPEAPALAQAIPGARFLHLPDCAHAVALEAPDQVTRAILEHLKSA
jgi:pyruvate/2-oxoglutarate dehydrogenase complex dihydrolipoamide acyltransferase (E2) component